MNQAHLHIILVHFPLLFYPFASGLLIWDLLKKKNGFTPLALGVLLVTSILGVAAFFLGEGAEHLVEHLTGINEEDIERHEEIAEILIYFLSVTGAMSLAAMISRSFRINFLKVIVIISVLSTLLLFKTAYEGGKIRHPEAHNSIL